MNLGREAGSAPDDVHAACEAFIQGREEIDIALGRDAIDELGEGRRDHLIRQRATVLAA